MSVLSYSFLRSQQNYLIRIIYIYRRDTSPAQTQCFYTDSVTTTQRFYQYFSKVSSPLDEDKALAVWKSRKVESTPLYRPLTVFVMLSVLTLTKRLYCDIFFFTSKSPKRGKAVVILEWSLHFWIAVNAAPECCRKDRTVMRYTVINWVIVCRANLVSWSQIIISCSENALFTSAKDSSQLSLSFSRITGKVPHIQDMFRTFSGRVYHVLKKNPWHPNHRVDTLMLHS